MAAYDEIGRFLYYADGNELMWVDLGFDPREFVECSLYPYTGDLTETIKKLKVFFVDENFIPLSNAVSIYAAEA